MGRLDTIAEATAASWDVALLRDDDLVARVRQLAPNGVDIVLDPSGTSLLELDLSVTAPVPASCCSATQKVRRRRPCLPSAG